ncbi:MAG: zinc ribbon domain-containing protein [Lachnospiraceae bacterium]|nr:zinc ribbon domain-containing protein [Lachnospiraceae bacterium]
MAFCPKCGAQVVDGAPFCEQCGTRVSDNGITPVYPDISAADPVDIYDHTAEYDPADVSENKCFAVLPYLFGILGIIVTAMISSASPYAMFHLRQAVKLTVVNTLLIICMAVLVWTVIVPIVGAVCCLIVFILRIIAVFQVFNGKAVEIAIIRSLGFLR